MAKKTRDGDALSDVQRAFLEIYIANGGNGTRAYLATHPNAQPNTAATNASRMLKNPKLANALRRRRAEVFAKYSLDADSALNLIALVATANISDAYDDDGKLLPVIHWPEHLRLAVREVRADGTVKLLDALKARQMIALGGGRIRRSGHADSFDHARYLGDEAHREPAT